MSLDNRKKTGLGEKIDSYEFDFDPAAWDDMEALLDGKKPSRKIFPFFLWFKILGGLVVLMALAFFFFNKKDFVKPVQKISETETSISKVEEKASPEIEKTSSEIEEKIASENIGHSTKTEITPQLKEDLISPKRGMKISKTTAKKVTPNNQMDFSFLPGFSNEQSLENDNAPYLPVLVWESADPDFVAKLSSKLMTVNQNSVAEKVYLQFDKSHLKAGEKISFSAFVRDANSLAAAKNGFLNIELSSHKNEVLENLKVDIENGIAVGELQIPETMEDGIYQIKAFTQSEKPLFKKAITVSSVIAFSNKGFSL